MLEAEAMEKEDIASQKAEIQTQAATKIQALVRGPERFKAPDYAAVALSNQADQADTIEGSVTLELVAVPSAEEEAPAPVVQAGGAVGNGVNQNNLAVVPAPINPAPTVVQAGGGNGVNQVNQVGGGNGGNNNQVNQAGGGNGGNNNQNNQEKAQKQKTVNIVKTISTHHLDALASVQSLSSASSNALNERLDKLAPAAVAAGGDDSMRFGAWISGLMGGASSGKMKSSIKDGNNQTTQNESKGFKSKFNAISLGADAEVMEDTIVGVAATMGSASVKSKDDTSLKSKISHSIFSIYGSTKLTDDITWSNIFSFGSGRIKTTRKEDSTTISAKAKTQSQRFETNLGYNIALSPENNIALTPSVGLKYESSKIGKYKETGGANNQNREVSGISNSSVSVTLGAKLSSRHKVSENFEIAPFISLGIEKPFGAKTKGVSVNLVSDSNAKLTLNTNKKNNGLGMNFGAGVTSIANNIEISASYNMQKQAKYLSHQGNLKLKVNL